MVQYEIIREGEEILLRVDFSQTYTIPTVEDDPRTMELVVKFLQEVKHATKIIINQQRDYEYDYEQTHMLLEVAQLQIRLVDFPINPLVSTNRLISQHYVQLQQIIHQKVRSDPIGAYVSLIRLIRHTHMKKPHGVGQVKDAYAYFCTILEQIKQEFEKIQLIKISQDQIETYDESHRDIYRQFFTPTIKPDFMLTKIMASYPKNAKEVDSFMIGKTQVTIFELADNVQYMYHIMPPEFQLSDELYSLLEDARAVLSEHKPQKEEFTDPERMREVFFNVGFDLIQEIANEKQVQLSKTERTMLTNILIRYTVGFGLIEILLEDEQMQDISINSPQGANPIYIVHGKYDECITNIMPTKGEAESWATKLRLISGRSLDEADPILDTELEFPNASVRVSAITYPLNPSGLAFSFRRHRDKPWTLPLFMKYKMINAQAAGLLSFFIDGSRTMLIAGTRSSGKSSFLSAIMIEIMRRYRMITIEDTLELPTKQMRELGFNIQPMKVASALGAKTSEMDASDGIRSTLRLGDSALIVGEVRSTEAKALYEAMRVGAAANVVAGTIHGDSPYGIFDRVVNDIGVPKTSFKATDIIIIANPIRSADGLHKYRRVLSITEVRKDWDDDPLKEHGFVELMRYNPLTDQLEPTDALIGGDSDSLKDIAGRVREFAGNWDAIWQNVQLRGQLKELLVQASTDANIPELLEAPFVISCNDEYHRLYEKVRQNKRFENEEQINQAILEQFEQWLQRQVRAWQKSIN
ncbi:MAG: ATPase, T2SS/T4P/T4SS family [Candidatus Woesearchaeota archaeon]